MAQESIESGLSRNEATVSGIAQQHRGWLQEFKTTGLTLFYSGMANALGTVAGHPLDTVRVNSIALI